jgi:hypothetical protein
MTPPASSDYDGQFREEDTGRAKWTLGALLALVTACLLCSLAFANITAEGAAKRSLAQSLAILTEVDTFLDVEYDDLRERAAATTEEVALTDFPVRVLFTPEEVLSGDRAEFRALLLSRAADRIHDDGASVLLEGRDGNAGLFSTEGVLRRGIDILRPAPHRVAYGLTIALAVVAAGLAVALASVTRGYGRLLAIGVSMLVSAAPFLAFAVAVRFAVRVAADGADDYISHELFRLGQELAWAPIRNSIIFAVGAGITAVAGSLLARMSDNKTF